jgi:hypothetical protein
MNENTKDDQRKNTAIAAVVDAGLDIAVREGSHPAAAHMLANGATFRVIVRVLSEHIYRRPPPQSQSSL